MREFSVFASRLFNTATCAGQAVQLCFDIPSCKWPHLKQVVQLCELKSGSAVPEEVRQESIVFSCLSSELLGSIDLLTKQVVKALQ